MLRKGEVWKVVEFEEFVEEVEVSKVVKFGELVEDVGEVGIGVEVGKVGVEVGLVGKLVGEVGLGVEMGSVGRGDQLEDVGSLFCLFTSSGENLVGLNLFQRASLYVPIQ